MLTLFDWLKVTEKYKHTIYNRCLKIESASKNSGAAVKEIKQPVKDRGGRYYRKKYRSPIYRHFSSYRQIINIEGKYIWELSISEKCIRIHPISTASKTRVTECFISRTNMNLSLKTVHKLERLYSPNILYCKICPFLP